MTFQTTCNVRPSSRLRNTWFSTDEEDDQKMQEEPNLIENSPSPQMSHYSNTGSCKSNGAMNNSVQVSSPLTIKDQEYFLPHRRNAKTLVISDDGIQSRHKLEPSRRHEHEISAPKNTVEKRVKFSKPSNPLTETADSVVERQSAHDGACRRLDLQAQRSMNKKIALILQSVGTQELASAHAEVAVSNKRWRIRRLKQVKNNVLVFFGVNTRKDDGDLPNEI
ncbi:hypothetical protein HK100_002912 [Physocladia obscura]|uniref:Uncharacterized protein n=1 Tax=Physocladia obscura TaxID=109957 RepID=A0AAD5SVL0_9FUNG|nr:hypothetical protein HK100_002912 [Physocladia obscura]